MTPQCRTSPKGAMTRVFGGKSSTLASGFVPPLSAHGSPFTPKDARIENDGGSREPKGEAVASLDLVLLGTLLFGGAALYASVGQAGATGFIAAMGLVGLPAATMRPTALALNILAAAFSTWRFHRAGLVAWRILRPFSLAAVPCAFLGGAIALPDSIYKPVIGVVLLIAAALLFRRVMAGASAVASVVRPPPLPLQLSVGGFIGLLSGLTATGGGVFLSPLLILFGWTTPRQAAGLSSPFILLNSIGGLIGAAMLTPQTLLPLFPLYAAVTLIGTLLGATLGIRYLPTAWILVTLGVVLTMSGMWLLWA
jgi:uncharacterized protein